VPFVERPDGARIHWEARGDGPLVVLCASLTSSPAVYEAVVSELARDHRVVTWDPRGCGDSTPEGPWDMLTDAADLGAVVGAAGGTAVALGMANGAHWAIRLAVSAPDLVRVVVTPGGVPLPVGALRDLPGLGGSTSVVEMLVGQVRRDLRSALRSMVASANSQLSSQDARARVDDLLSYSSREALISRGDAWATDDLLQEERDLGDRLVALPHGSNPWFPAEAVELARELLPHARIEEVEDGPLSRPDLTAEVVRRLPSRA
jgi:pimeloyl-ACP methyl ester carboxylesterase